MTNSGRAPISVLEILDTATVVCEIYSESAKSGLIPYTTQ